MHMYKANDISQWFINRAIESNANEGGDYITNLKLHKLMYYAQGCHLAMYNEPLFNEEIYNWEYGPVVKSIYQCNSKNPFTEYKQIKIDEKTNALLEEVYKVFGKFSAWALMEMTHSEDPWKNTNRNDIIPKESIRQYFVENVVE